MMMTATLVCPRAPPAYQPTNDMNETRSAGQVAAGVFSAPGDRFDSISGFAGAGSAGAVAAALHRDNTGGPTVA